MLDIAPSSRMIRPARPWTAGSLRLFCIPYAGGRASVYDSWITAAPDWVQVCPVELPGRGWLGEVPLPGSLAELAQGVTSAIYPYTDNRYAIFGHSMGALLAYEVASRLEALGRNEICRLFVSGCRAPFLVRDRPTVSRLPDIQFLKHVRSMRGTPEEVLANAELMEILLPILRADFRICEEYSLTDAPLLRVPLTIFGGEQDEDVPERDMKMWGHLTVGERRSLMFPGGHFFLKESENDVLSAVFAELEQYRARHIPVRCSSRGESKDH